jgi:hypothetical protein
MKKCKKILVSIWMGMIMMKKNLVRDNCLVDLKIVEIILNIKGQVEALKKLEEEDLKVLLSLKAEFMINNKMMTTLSIAR